MSQDLTTTDDSGVISIASALAVVRAQALGIKESIAAWDLRPLPKRSRAKMDSSRPRRTPWLRR